MAAATVTRVDGTDAAAIKAAIEALAPSTATVNYIFPIGTDVCIVKYVP